MRGVLVLRNTVCGGVRHFLAAPQRALSAALKRCGAIVALKPGHIAYNRYNSRCARYESLHMACSLALLCVCVLVAATALTSAVAIRTHIRSIFVIDLAAGNQVTVL